MIETKEKESTKQSSSEKPGVFTPPAISLPKGGGAIRGIGEKFAANPVTGTGSMTVPIATSPGRSGFGPQLSLSYDSGAGNGPFGIGWNLSLPAITRKTDKGLPRYWDAIESDVFILSGAEDLVPVLNQDANGKWVPQAIPSRKVNGVMYSIKRYRPRIEGLFACIDRWTNQDDPEDVIWRSISKDNITTWYGKSKNSRIFDSLDPTRIFSWLICESYDDKGNVIGYEYKEENSDDIDFSQVHEGNRKDETRRANRYLKHIRYGNHKPYFPQIVANNSWPSLPRNDEWFFEVVFDYGEHDEKVPMPGMEVAKWKCRNDPFSTYRSGFEIRTYRLCQRVLMFHHFKNEENIGLNCLVRSTDFAYSYEQDLADPRNPIYSALLSVSQSGYKRQGGTYFQKSLPPLEFEYTQAEIDETVRDVDPESLESLPYGLDGTNYQWVDLDGEGLSGILTEQSGSWFYKRNLSPINTVEENGSERVNAKFASIELVKQKPSLAALGGGRQQLLDLAGDGQLDLAEFQGPTPGFYERTKAEGWESLVPFSSLPVLDWSDPNLKFVDLTGDGHADILITEDDVFTWLPSLAEAGFAAAERTHQAWDEKNGPRVVFADGTQSIYLADISGDGLTDLVRIRNGEVCYWPNLGYGLFGRKVTMDNSPMFDIPDLFDQKRIRLADIDGSGTTDIMYIDRNGIQIYFNLSGNSWSKQRHIGLFPHVDDLSSVMTADLLGNGTACLIWSSPLPGDTRRPMRYIDLMGGQKPHLLVRSANNLGAETYVKYAPSTKFYLSDRQESKPWVTKIPFPVYVVERVETFDYISRNRFVTSYSYHHGYFDGIEREFRGFGRVDQLDTEEFAALSKSEQFPIGTNVEKSSHVPPVLTRTWFHTGVYLGRDHVSDFFAGLLDGNDTGEYYHEPGLNDDRAIDRLLDDTPLPDGLNSDEEREACRALKGYMLRQEIYALDGTTKEKHPYTVTEQNFTIVQLQPQIDNRHAVFFTHARESISYHYEREPADPRISHALTLEVDGFGNVLKENAIGYGRRQPDPNLPLQADRDKQTQTLITYTENGVTNAINDPIMDADNYRTPLPCETRTYELTGFKPTDNAERFSFDEWIKNDFELLKLAAEIMYEETADFTKKQKRLIEQVRTLYRKNDLTVLLPLSAVDSQALPGESYKLAFTPGLARLIFVDSGKLTEPELDGLLADEGKYVHSINDANWWIPSGKVFFDVNADVTNPEGTAALELIEAHKDFFLPRKFADPFHQSSTVDYDGYDLLVAKTKDALGNTVAAVNDYRVLQPKLVTDPNRNRTEVAFDTLGMMVGTAVKGKIGTVGDTLTGFEPDLTQAQVDSFYDVLDPHVPAVDLLKGATTRIIYDLDRFRRSRLAQPADPAQWLPVYAATLARETHVSDPLPSQGLKIQISFSYSDGFGREIQKKIQAEPGPAVSLRWVGSGWTIFNNKGGKPVRQYEPFFSQLPQKSHRFEFGIQVGISPILFYDPVERVIATLHPNHTYEKVVFDPWQQITYDVNDTVAPSGTETGDPRTDADIKGYVAEYFKTQPNSWQTWYEERITGNKGPQEKSAAEKAAKHANTPTTAHFDTLGRPFLTLAHNGFEQDGTLIQFPTRVKLDIENNQREVRDAVEQNGDPQGRIVMRYDYDMLSSRIHQASMEAGERWMLNDVAGKPIRAWDSRGFIRRMTYDELRRPIGLFVTENGNEREAERTKYGETLGDTENHRTRVYQVFDGAGVVTSEAYDFKGNLLRSRRELLADYKQAVNWRLNPAPNDGTYATSTTYDALNRPLTVTTPDKSVYSPSFNEANLLDKVDVNLRGSATQTHFVTNIDYNAKGQRELIAYGNGARTTYEYDPFTFRLIRLKTTRPGGLNGLASQLFTDPTIVQDLCYTYDPAGNITRIEDAALKTIFFNNEQVEPICAYTYDAIYRLIEAKGREHIGQTAFDFDPVDGNRRDFPFVGLRTQLNDAQAMSNYTESYQYDGVGNFTFMRHIATAGTWKRNYEYNAPSLIEPLKQSNRLTKTVLGNGFNFTEAYTYIDAQGNDVHGCMTAINSMTMVWDFKDQLQQVDLGGGGTAYYVYDAAGQRLRKVIESQNGMRRQERIYCKGFEIYRKLSGTALTRETLHIMDDQQRIALVETRTEGNGPGIPVQLIRYQFGNHLGSASLELDDNAQIVSYEEYKAHGSTSYQSVRSESETPKRYRYTAKERDGESGLYYHGVRYYASWLGRWTSADPMGLVDGPNTYAYVAANPIVFVDKVGTDRQRAFQIDVRYYGLNNGEAKVYGSPGWAKVVSAPPKRLPTPLTKPVAPRTPEKPEERPVDSAVTKDNPQKVAPFADPEPADREWYKAGSKTRELGFFLRHPVIATEIGEEQHGSENISTNATRFAAGLGLTEVLPSHEGSEVNAFRHALWQSTITVNYGASIARQVGAAHENNPLAVQDVTDTTNLSFKTLAEADQSIDLLNNQIGRRLGLENPGLSMRDLAFTVLEEFRVLGLFTATQNADGSFSISRSQLSKDKYARALKKLTILDNLGFEPAERLQHDRERAEQKAEQRRLQREPKF